MRDRRIIGGPDSVWGAFTRGFCVVLVGAGVPLTVALAFRTREWSDIPATLLVILAVAGGGALVIGVISTLPVITKNWAWRQISKGTPVADDEER